MSINELYEDILNKLTDRYKAWNKEQSLSLGSADEHLFDKDLTQDQRDWLKDFSNAWDAVILLQRGK